LALSQTSATSLYRYYDEFDVLLYVGITSRGARRNAEHNKTKPWWPYVARQDVSHFGTRDEALAREAELILADRPPFNMQHNPTHRIDQAVYLAAREKLANQPSDPVELWRQQGKSFPLLAVPGEGFVTHPEHLPVTGRMSITGAVRVVIGSVVVGRVRAVERRGPFVYLDANVRREALAEVALADVKLQLTKAGPEFSLSRVRLPEVGSAA
jgi:predicted GIY-YIG superfamily endonuclease